MRAVIIDAPGIIRVDNVPDPTPRPDEVLVRVGACGICGTDLHIIDGDSPLARYPIIPGHEFAGEVVALGSDVAQRNGKEGVNITVGSRIAIEPNLYCGYCDSCRTGHENLCLNYAAIGVTTNGAIAQYVTVPIAKAYALPDNISLREAALIEPVSCAVHGMHSLNPRSGDTFLIVGAGTMGLLLLQLAVRGGASRVAMVDVNAQRLALAEQLGPTRTYSDIKQALKDEPLGFNCVIDATGIAAVIENAFLTVKRGGKFLIFGVASPEAHISLSPFLISSGVINTQAMLTTALPLQDFLEALDMVRYGKGVKTQILPNA
ncbi:MAG: zinc-dependent alcohol dehydrogenase family protein [Chloroflexi bacterium]|nr:MAG: zinc-dependent alcohol dehydrogenase family protein [Chloroflexota bacterium]